MANGWCSCRMSYWLICVATPGSSADVASGDAMAELLAEVAELRERLGHATGQLLTKDEVIAELRAQLAWHWLPWWRRLIGP